DYKEDYKYAHAYNTMLILERFGIKDPIILASAYHHQPSKAGSEESQLYAKLYSLADRLSSVERSEKESKEEIPLLYSIFQNINFSLRHNDSSSKGSEREEYVYLPKPLDLSKETLFPKKSKELKNIYGANLKESHELKKLYKGLWESFRRDFEVVSSYLNKEEYERALNIVYYLLYRYFWAVPSAIYDPKRETKHYSDISIFDHLRLTSAFASAFYTEYNKKIVESGNEKEIRNLKLVFVKGDISGIQNFLYGITNVKGVAKRLRGRSFFLDVLPELIARALLDEFGYPITNLLFSGGGHFEVVLGYEEEIEGKKIEEKLQEFAHRIDKILFNEFYGKLGFIISFRTKTKEELEGKDRRFSGYAEVIKEIQEDLDFKKKRKFLAILTENGNLDDYFKDLNKDLEKPKGSHVLCESCRIAVVEEEKGICDWCDRFMEIGGALPKINYIVFSKEKPKEEKSKEIPGFYIEGIGGCYFLKDLSDKNKFKNLKDCYIYKINNTDFVKEDGVLGFRFYAKVVPRKLNGEPKTFEELADEAKGYKRIAFLRADVDNLGLIFRKGLGEDYSISRVATLSRMLDLFFSGYLNTFLEEEVIREEEGKKEGGGSFKDKVYILYAGGDDLFLIGPWDVIVDAIIYLRERFKEYTCENKLFDLSCGVFIERGSYPIRLAGHFAGEEEKEAKKEKPAIKVLNEILKWEPFKDVKKDCDEMVSFVEERKIGRTLFYRFYQLLTDYKEKKKKNLSEMYRFYPLFFYYLNRNVKDGNEKIIQFFMNKENNYEVRDEAYFKAKYVIMKTRE
ncbi:MAG: type III-A CRISPR-associated protein Cas10/Csm1, partial [Caldimicrobium thiodismutans]